MKKTTQELTKERGDVYGHPLDNFHRFALMKKGVVECQDEEVAAILEMILLKVSRLVESPAHEDSIEDIKGYAETISMVHKERELRKSIENEALKRR